MFNFCRLAVAMSLAGLASANAGASSQETEVVSMTAGPIPGPVGGRTTLPASEALAGSSVRVKSLLNAPAKMRHGDHIWNEAGVIKGRIWVRVDRTNQLISVFRGAHEIGTAVILYGALRKPTPAGTYPILAKMKNHRSSIYNTPMPYTLRLTHDGISIHARSVREGLATHGCIGVPDEFARRLFAAAKAGDRVVII